MCARAVRDMCCGSRLFCSVWWHLHKYTVQHGDLEQCVAARCPSPVQLHDRLLQHGGQRLQL